MRLPKTIKTRNKLRDSKIVQLYLDGMTYAEIGRKFRITKTTVGHILRKNVHLLTYDVGVERVKRIQHLKRLLDKVANVTGEKDAVDILKEIRTEFRQLEDKTADRKTVDRVVIIKESAPASSEPLDTLTNLRGGNGDTHPEGQVSRSISFLD